MKNKIKILLAISFFIMFMLINVSAEKEEQLKNILDLSNILIYEEPENSNANYYLKTNQSINLIKDEYYTFIISEDFFDERGFGNPLMAFEAYYSFFNSYTNIETGKTMDYIFTDSYAYFTFKAEEELFNIKEFPIEVIPRKLNQDIMLFKGDITLFSNKYFNYKSTITPVRWIYLKDYDLDLNIEDIISSITLEDIDNETLEVIYDDYSLNKNKLGEFDILLLATSKSNNRSYLNIVVKIIDITPPEIIGESYYTIELNENMPSLQTILLDYRIIDNYSSLQINDLKIIEDAYTINKNNLGKYNVILEVEDESFNSTRFEITFDIVDITPPTLTGPREIYKYTTDPVMKNDDIKKLFSVTDNIDKDLIKDLIIEGSYESVPGSYDYTLTISDKSGNTVVKSLTINVLSGNIPAFIDNDTFIITYNKYKNMTQQEMIDWIKSSNSDITNIKILLDETNYLKSKDKKMYVYYSYILNNITYYGRILVNPSLEKTITTKTIISIIFLLNIGVFIAFIKRPKIHL